MPASISSKTSVSPPATAAIASAIRESSPPDAVSATGASGRPAFGRTRKTASSAPVAPGSRSCSSQTNSPSPIPTSCSSDDTASANAGAAAFRSARSSAASAAERASAARKRLGGDRSRILALVERLELGAGLGSAGEQLVVALAAEAPLRLGDLVERRLELFEASGLGLERREERVQLRGGLAQPQLDVAQLVAGALELGREPLERRDGALGERDEAGCALALVRRQRLGGGRGGLRRARSRDAAARARRAARPPRPAPCPSVSSTSARSSSSRAAATAAFSVSSSRRRRAASSSRQAARAARAALQLLVAAEPVEHLELVRRPCEPPLLELPRHRDDAFDRSGHVLARRGPAPRVGARPAVAEDPARDDQHVLVLGPELGQLLELVGQVELGLDVRLRRGRPDERSRRPSSRAGARPPARGSSSPRRSRP